MQQSTYTMCTAFRAEWRFAPHDKVVITEGEDVGLMQDVVWKFVLPTAVRESVLARLEDYNINAAALFGTDESLIETIAMREFTLRHG